MSEKAVILVSGGMDSCVSAAEALRAYIPYFLHIQYGQRTAAKELEAFHKIADYYKVEHKLVVELNHFSQIGGSALTDREKKVPEGLSEGNKPATYVPFRNANLLSAAVSWAETVKAARIYIGATEEDSAGYPDCRKSFFLEFNKLIKEGTQEKNIEIVTPVIEMKKAEIVKRGIELNAPFALTWSCYERDDIACGRCDSCIRRRRAFAEAGIADPIVYSG